MWDSFISFATNASTVKVLAFLLFIAFVFWLFKKPLGFILKSKFIDKQGHECTKESAFASMEQSVKDVMTELKAVVKDVSDVSRKVAEVSVGLENQIRNNKFTQDEVVELRKDIRGVHSRVDDVLKMLAERLPAKAGM